MSTLLERLHAKYNQNRPWTETMKLVRQVMVRMVGIPAGGFGQSLLESFCCWFVRSVQSPLDFVQALTLCWRLHPRTPQCAGEGVMSVPVLSNELLPSLITA